MITKKNRTWILRDHKHITQSIFIVDKGLVGFPLSENLHDLIDEVEKVSDIHFVFTTDTVKTIDPEKFSELYQGVSYSICPDRITGVLTSIEYDREIYPGQHIAYFLSQLGWYTEGLRVGVFKKLIENLEVLKRSIFKPLRLGPEELEYSYSKKGKSWWKPVSRDNTYTTHTIAANESVLFLKPELWEEIRVFLEGHQGYLETFKDPWDFFGSITERLGRPDLILKQDPGDVKVSTVGV